MKSVPEKLDQFIQGLTLLTIVFTIIMGGVLVFAELKPFWIDEWFIIYNLKTKDVAGIWGKLELMQQFPRVYLVLFKLFSSLFNYSYFSLRFPSYVVGCAVALFGFKMTEKIFNKDVFSRYLFVLLVISSGVFTDYFVVTKQYTMELLLAIVAIWQLTELLQLKTGYAINKQKYIVLCSSLIVVPFFSYTYPIVIAPVYVVVFLSTYSLYTSQLITGEMKRIIAARLFPLFLSMLSIFLFYVADVRQLMSDNGMHSFWGYLMMDGQHVLTSFIRCFYALFSQIGAGVVFENVIGILGVCAFIYGLFVSLKGILRNNDSLEASLKLYSCLVVLITVVLFFLKKLPMGVQRLNAFTIPAIAILIIYLLSSISSAGRWGMAIKIFTVVLYLAVAGNVFSTCYAFFTVPEYKKQLLVYRVTEKAIRLAQVNKAPIIVTAGISYPYDISGNYPDGISEPSAWLLMTFPAYNIESKVPIYVVKELADAHGLLQRMPGTIKSAVAGDGSTFSMLNRD